jgi:hypothetical protein
MRVAGRRFLGAALLESPETQTGPMRIRPEASHYASVLLLSASGTVLVAFAYLRVHADLMAVEQAQGYVDPVLQDGIYLGFFVMLLIGGLLAALAVWSGVKLLRARGKDDDAPR